MAWGDSRCWAASRVADVARRAQGGREGERGAERERGVEPAGKEGDRMGGERGRVREQWWLWREIERTGEEDNNDGTKAARGCSREKTGGKG